MNKNTKESRTAIVTGASSGIGLGIAQALLEQGYNVVANSRTISRSKGLKASANLVLVDGDISKKHTVIITNPIALTSPARAYHNWKPTENQDRD